MAFPVQAPDYQQQLGAIQAQLANMKKASTYTPLAPIHQVMPVDGISGAEAILKEMPPGSSDIVAHRTEDIIYLLARDENGVPMPIKPAKIEWISAEDDPTGYVTKKDLEDFKAELKAMFAER